MTETAVITTNHEKTDFDEIVQVKKGFRLTAAIVLTMLAVTGAAQMPASFVPGLLARQGSTYEPLWPQGWTFFASEPTAQVLVAYRFGADGQSLSPATVREASAETFWGLRRVAEAQQVETRQLAAAVPDAYWSICSGLQVSACRAGLTASRPRVANHARHSTLCGTVALAVAVPEWPARADRGGRAGWRVIALTVAEVACDG